MLWEPVFWAVYSRELHSYSHSVLNGTDRCRFILLGASASQLGFFYTTGNEVKWSEARSYAGDAKGMKILLSGINSVLAAGAIIVVVAWVAKWFLYRAVGSLITTVGTPLACGKFNRDVSSPTQVLTIA